MSAPTTSNSGVNVRISWQPPINNGGSTVTQYQVIIVTSTGTYSENTQYCDGSVASVIANLYCDVPMSVLWASPYNNIYGDLVKAKVSAKNAIGWNTLSDPNTVGAYVQTVPV